MTSYSLIKTAADGAKIIRACLAGTQGSDDLLRIVAAKLEIESEAAKRQYGKRKHRPDSSNHV